MYPSFSALFVLCHFLVSLCVCVFVHTGHDTLCHTCTVVVLHPTLLLGTRSHGFVCMAASMPVAPCSPADHIYIVLHLSSPIHVIHTYIHRYPCTLFSPELADAMNALLSSKFVPPEVSQLHSKPRRSVLAAGVFFFFRGWNLKKISGRRRAMLFQENQPLSHATQMISNWGCGCRITKQQHSYMA